jgi:ribonuclease HII
MKLRGRALAKAEGSALLCCGIDEAGRGPLAGAVYAAAVILDAARPVEGLADSKILSAAERERLAAEIRAQALAWAVAFASVEEIDRFNILRATFMAMRRAVTALPQMPDEVIVDGKLCPPLDCRVRAVVKADATVAQVSAASILAKTARDAEMCRLHQVYPLYGFEQHKGYGTPEHLRALREHGVCPIHRRSFAPVRDLLPQTKVTLALAWD